MLKNPNLCFLVTLCYCYAKIALFYCHIELVKIYVNTGLPTMDEIAKKENNFSYAGNHLHKKKDSINSVHCTLRTLYIPYIGVQCTMITAQESILVAWFSLNYFTVICGIS